MSAQLSELQDDRAQYQEQLDLVLGSLRDDPGNAELSVLKEELESALEMINDSIAELKPKKPSPPSPSSAAASTSNKNSQKSKPSSSSPWSAQPSRSDEKSSSSGVGTDKAAAAPHPSFKANDHVMARWVSGDKLFYPARIVSITGSSQAPMYTIKFKSYDTIETLRAKDVRPLNSSSTGNNNGSSTAASSSGAAGAGSKRKVDGSASESAAHASASHPPAPPASAQPPPPPPSSSAVPPPPPPVPVVSGFRTMDRFNSGVVSSAAAQLYPHALQQQNQGSGSGSAAGDNSAAGDAPPPKKFKKIKATKQLEAGKSKWQEFNNKSKFGKSASKKDSMFRTPEGIHGRVGFTGSGQAMRKDPTRSRHVYQTNEELD